MRDNQKLLDEYKAAQYLWEKEAIDNEDFYHNLHYTPEQEERYNELGLFNESHNVLTPLIEMAISYLTRNSPRWVATAVGNEDVNAADHVSKLLEHVWGISNGNYELKTAVKDAYLDGRGVLCLSYNPDADYGRGELFIKSIDTLNVFPDPNSKDVLWRDATNILYSEKVSESQLRANMPSALNEPSGFIGVASNHEPTSAKRMSINGVEYVPKTPSKNGTEKTFDVITRFTKIRIGWYLIHENPTNNDLRCVSEESEQWFQPEDYFSTYKEKSAFIITDAYNPDVPTYICDDLQVAQYMDIWEQGTDIEEAELPTRVIKAEPVQNPQTGEMVEQPDQYIMLVNKGYLIEQGVIEYTKRNDINIYYNKSIGNDVFEEAILDSSEYPIVPIHFRHSRNPYPKSDVSYCKPLQKTINMLWMRYIQNISQFNSLTILSETGAIRKEDIEDNAGKAGVRHIEYNNISNSGNSPFTIIPPPAIPDPRPMIEEQKNTIQDILGFYLWMQGNQNNTADTYRGMMTLQENAQGRISEKRDQIDLALNHIGSVAMQWIARVYREEKTLHIAEGSTTINERFGRNSVTNMTYNVRVKSGSMLPTNRAAKVEIYKEIALMASQSGNPIAVPLIRQMLLNMDVPNIDEIIQESDMISQLQGQLEGLSQENQLLNNKLRTLESELVTSRTQSEVTKAKAELETILKTAQLSTELNNQLSKQNEALRQKEHKLSLRENKPNNNHRR